MRKMIFTFMLAIVSSVWMTKAACLMQAPEAMYQPFETVSGTLTSIGFPCEGEEPCPPCLTIALVTDAKTYYLSTSDAQMQAQLDELEMQLPLRATISGTPFVNGSFDFIKVQSVSVDNSLLPSLCDEWNVLHEPFECMGPYCYLETDIYRLKGDTGISIFIDMPVIYYKLEKNGQYIGALHEGNNRDIYYVPANSQNAYLLYAFNAQVGDELENVWLGGETEKKDCTNAHNATVIAISDSNPRIFTLEIIPFTSYEGMEVYPYWMEWIEGVGMSDGPVGAYDSNKLCPSAADLGVFTLLCAYKDGEQVYTSTMGEQYGCEFNGIPSTKPYHLCDEWNIAKISNAFGPQDEIHTVKAVLEADTIIQMQRYVKLIEAGAYQGALREGESGVIYYIPAGSAHEYLLYKFNAKVGDRLTNLWYGGDPERCPNGYNATVLSISDETPRVFTIEVEYILSDSDGEHIIPWTIDWTEGVGLSDGPAGQYCPGPECACSCGQVLLCAYKNGEQVYVSEMGEQYGCVYNYDPYAAPTDTIPLFSYTGDDPGSSTIDPVDPNQVVVTLNGDKLTIREHTGVDITYSLQHNAPSQMPSLHRALQSDTFRDMVTLQITESGEYQLLLTNPSWGYSIFGNFIYAPQGIEQISSSSQGGETSRLVLMNGQIYILRGEKIYTLTGQEVR